MNSYLKKIIAQGEHQQLDFKFEISNSKKIARTLAAFANTDGGKLLVGVKDNGMVAGVRSEEEYFMLDAAANMYCKPAMNLKIDKWDIDGKTVLEVTVGKSYEKLYYAPDNDNKWKVYVRSKDKSLLANKVWIQVWLRKNDKKSVQIKYTDKEKALLQYLDEHKEITLSKFCKIAQVPRFIAEKILINLIAIDVLNINFTEKQVYYYLRNKKWPSLLG